MAKFITSQNERKSQMKKEIVVDGKASDWFEKATFVLKETGKVPVSKDLFSYAEDIVETYLKRNDARDAYRAQDLFMQTGKKSMASKGKGVKVSDLQQAADKLEAKYNCLQQEKIILKKKENIISTFCFLSVTVCIISILLFIMQ